MRKPKPTPVADVEPEPESEPRSPAPAMKMETIENLLVPETYATEVPFFAVGNGMVTLTLASQVFDHSLQPAVPKLVVTGRLVLPIASAQALAAGLYDFLKKRGLDPAQPPRDPTQVM